MSSRFRTRMKELLGRSGTDSAVTKLRTDTPTVKRFVNHKSSVFEPIAEQPAVHGSTIGQLDDMPNIYGSTFYESPYTPTKSTMYEAIPLLSPTSFRLLEVKRWSQPGEIGMGDLISCKLYVADLSDSPAFTALSYMWGSPYVTKTIFVNDQPFQVRENLWDFLYKASNRSHPDLGPMWIDAICIDQASIPERNHQVSFMGLIYSNAVFVISWLGSLTPRLSRAIDWLNVFTLKPTESEVEVDQDIAVVRAVHELYDHAYWKRLWIIQEVVLARDVQVWCGHHHVPLRMLYSATKQTPKLWKRLLYTRVGVVNLAAKRVLDRRYSSHNMRIYSREGTSPGNVSEATNKSDNDLCSLLKVTGLAHCEDPRDGLFGILSILSPREKQLLDIQPDYSKDREAIVLDVVDKVWIHLAKCDTQEYHRYMYWIFKALKLPQVYLFYQLYPPAIAIGEDKKKYYDLWKKKQAEEMIEE